MAKHSAPESLVDMDRLSRIFTWLVATVFTFMLGMVFMQAIQADTAASSYATLTQPASAQLPYTFMYPQGWSVGYDAANSLVSKDASELAVASESMVVLNDEPIAQPSGLGEGFLVTLAKIRPDATATYDRYIGTPGDGSATTLTVPGTTAAVQLTDLETNTGTMDRVVMTVGSDLYVMDLVTKRGDVDYTTDMAAVLASLDFSK